MYNSAAVAFEIFVACQNVKGYLTFTDHFYIIWEVDHVYGSYI